MLNTNRELGQREREGKIIKCGIVGTGQMGRGMVIQMMLTKGITSAVVSDIDLEFAIHASKYVGVKDVGIVRTSEAMEADRVMDGGKYVVTTNSNLTSQCRPVEVIISVTEVPGVGAKVITDVISNKKHVIILNVETDVVIGPLLDKMAEDNGVIYTGSAGDEPGAVMELYDFAMAMGLEVKVTGKGKNNRIDKNCSPGMVLEEATRRKMSPRMLRASKGDTKTMVEVTTILDVVGLVPDIVGEHGTASDVKGLNETYKLKEDSGILKQHGVTGYVNEIASGTLVTVATDDEEVVYQM